MAHIHIMANYFIAANAAIDITFTFGSLARSIFVSLIVSARLLFWHYNKTDGHFYRIRTKTEKSPEFICSNVMFALYNNTIYIFDIADHTVHIHTWLCHTRIICSSVPFYAFFWGSEFLSLTTQRQRQKKSNKYFRIEHETKRMKQEKKYMRMNRK